MYLETEAPRTESERVSHCRSGRRVSKEAVAESLAVHIVWAWMCHQKTTWKVFESGSDGLSGILGRFGGELGIGGIKSGGWGQGQGTGMGRGVRVTL